MTKQEFLSALQETLSEELNGQQVLEYMNYYRQYIEQQMAEGRSEAAVLEELGDARIIARNIIDGISAETDSGQNRVYEQTQMTYTSEDGWKLRLKTYGCLALALLVIFLIIAFVTRLIIFLLPSLLVIGLLVWIFKQFNQR